MASRAPAPTEPTSFLCLFILRSTKGASEPGLILTPPETASEEDDGYLSASEIAALKLDADLVILSACNTAAGQASNAEAFGTQH